MTVDSSAHLAARMAELTERERMIDTREANVFSRENEARIAEAANAATEGAIVKLRKANEHLVIATVRAQVMTEEVQKAKDQMDHMAHHDFLTNLPNRIELKEKLTQGIALAKRHNRKLAVLFVDLDRFKTINDSLGHDIGDALLRAVAQRLLNSVRSTDTVSRQGGDEFVVLLSELEDEQGASAFAEKMCKTIAEPYLVAEQTLCIGATIGISLYPDCADSTDVLIRNADMAMYFAKDCGRGGFQFFRQEMNLRAMERHTIEADLYRALGDHQFELFYQAQIDLKTGRVIGGEALIRWWHPTRGLLLPAAFIPIAEKSRAIVPIGKWVLGEACRQTQAWLDDGFDLDVVAVNVSALEFCAADFVQNVHKVLHETGLAPEHLELELTESVLMEHAESTVTMLHTLKSIGIRIAIDDFGTGYSSLSYLKQFPVDTLKIDRSFLEGIKSKNDDGILVDSVISLGRNLQHRVIAEGIETSEQKAFLHNHHCCAGQGFYLSRPMKAKDFQLLLGRKKKDAGFLLPSH